MLNANVNLDHVPEDVTVEPLPNGNYRIIMYDGVKKVKNDEGISYNADEVSFTLSYPISEEEIVANFDDWWDFGVENDSDIAELTLDERLSAIEAGLAAILLGE